jgi:hypothetical protein
MKLNRYPTAVISVGLLFVVTHCTRTETDIVPNANTTNNLSENTASPPKSDPAPNGSTPEKTPEASVNDIRIVDISLYGYNDEDATLYIDNKKMQKGEKFSLDVWNPYNLAPHRVGVEVKVKNSSEFNVDVDVQLEIAPKIGHIIEIEGSEGFIDFESTEKNAEWFPTVLVQETASTIKPRETSIVSFEIQIYQLISNISSQGNDVWPVAFRFSATVIPEDFEDTNLKNNVREIDLTVRTRDS